MTRFRLYCPAHGTEMKNPHVSLQSAERAARRHLGECHWGNGLARVVQVLAWNGDRNEYAPRLEVRI